ncbi:MAG: UDP-N-acetylmuramyl-tripeptide synthetase [Candidatus Uhrbacteria bacterium]
MLKRLLRKIIPKPIFRLYHWTLSIIAAFLYGHPSRDLTVIGVTGTSGKTTTVEWIGRIIEHCGETVGWATTNSFKIGSRESTNATKMTMLGRFQTQKMLREMARTGCKYAIVETSSQGIEQYRHLGIDYDLVLLTNLWPEHIEAHGGFENYKKAKGKLFEHLGKKIRKQENKKISIVNLDSEHADYFLKFKADKKYGFGTGGKDARKGVKRNDTLTGVVPIQATKIKTSASGSSFTIKDTKFHLGPIGLHNVENATAAVATTLALGFDIKLIADAVARLPVVPGRLEVINEGQPFNVIVDYAFEPVALSKLFETVQMFEHKRIIHLVGSTGGGRDVSRRPKLGRLSSELADVTIVTNEDPYDDDPQEIIDQVAAGALEVGSHEGEDLYRILDRAQAIKKAITLADKGDIVLITGKGSEPVMAVKNGKTIPWDDRAEARKVLHKKIKN